ncbi:hypothetical protein EKP31_20590 [Salmonella enterica]|nr:hypothetical protein [Salmonella enterica]
MLLKHCLNNINLPRMSVHQRYWQLWLSLYGFVIISMKQSALQDWRYNATQMNHPYIPIKIAMSRVLTFVY